MTPARPGARGSSPPLQHCRPHRLFRSRAGHGERRGFGDAPPSRDRAIMAAATSQPGSRKQAVRGGRAAGTGAEPEPVRGGRPGGLEPDVSGASPQTGAAGEMGPGEARAGEGTLG